MKKFIKNGLVMEVSDTCACLFLKNGWGQYNEIENENENLLDSASVDEKASGNNVNEAPNLNIEESPRLSKREITRMNKDTLLLTAQKLGYTITSDKRNDIIEEFLKQHGE